MHKSLPGVHGYIPYLVLFSISFHREIVETSGDPEWFGVLLFTAEWPDKPLKTLNGFGEIGPIDAVALIICVTKTLERDKRDGQIRGFFISSPVDIFLKVFSPSFQS